MRSTPKVGVLSLVLVSVCLAGCDALTRVSTDNSARYQTMKDSTGRLVRFDTITGETTPFATTAAAPRPARRAMPEPVVETDKPIVEAAAPAAVVVAEADPAPPAEEPQPSAVVALLAPTSPNACLLRHDLGPADLVVSAPADVFVRPARLRQPVTTLPINKVVTRVDGEGEWLLVRFDDQWVGQRSGYVHCTNVVLASPEPSEAADRAGA